MPHLALTCGFVLLVSLLASFEPQLFLPLTRIPSSDKLGHFLLIGLLAYSAVVTLAPRRVAGRRFGALASCGMVAAVITLEEFSQTFIATRSFSWLDLGASYAGIAAFGAAASLRGSAAARAAAADES
ncbi:MAG: VanZ family protein [Proteobacteria bacterium]|nr:VanZ family protein [Pseudomonadota bacterium]